MSATPPPENAGAAPDPLIGQILNGTHRVEKLLGVGGMGNVYLAAHTRLPKKVAIKVVRSELAKDSANFERFQREANIASSLGNRHIVDVQDFNTLPDGTPYMVMEFLTGEDLATRLARLGRLGLPECNHIISQVVSALDTAHGRGIVHRDIKPENIFLCQLDEEADFVKLLDFGLSKMRGSQKRLTANLSVLGTPWYMSPEQARGDSDLDHRTDIYALGVVVYQALCGRVPFDGENVYAVLTQIATQPPPPMSRWSPDLPAGLEAAVLRALNKNPADRPATAGEFWDEAQRGMEATNVRRPVSTAVRSVPATLPDGSPFRVPTPSGLAPPAPPVPWNQGPSTDSKEMVLPLSTDARAAARALASDEALGQGPTTPARQALSDEVLAGLPPPGRAKGRGRSAEQQAPATLPVLGVAATQLSIPPEPEPAPARSSPAKLVGISFAITIVVGVVGLLAFNASRGPTPVTTVVQVQPPLVPQPAPEPTPAPPPKPAAPTEVSLQVEGLPEGAVLTLDGQKLTSPARVKASSQPAKLAASAPGYKPAEQSIVLDADRVVRFALEREPAPTPPTPTPTPTPTPAVKAEQPSGKGHKASGKGSKPKKGGTGLMSPDEIE